ncbi:MAG: presqualene diphosphate synthase HpnD [Acidobacteria bacterium]|nr:presqualene diphosphate synthase HpnD [Acidobacteriota bacterium]
MGIRSRNRHLTNARATNFYYSFLFLTPEKRRAIEAVYHFARRGDDITDENLPVEEAARAIADYRAALDDCFRGQGSTPEVQALAESVARFKIPRQPFEDLILGLEMDLAGRRYDTFEDLELYCYRVASTIGLISIEIFGYRNPSAREYAVNLGKALQLVNIMRDIESDGQRGRIYLPKADLDRFDLRPGEILQGRYGDPFIELMQCEGDRAQEFFSRARKAIAPEDRRSMLAAEIMGAIYWRLLGRIRARRYNVFGERVRVSRPLKLWTALSVYLGLEWFPH